MGSSASPVLLPYQQRFVNDRSPLKVWLASRQIGKAVDEALAVRSDNLIAHAPSARARA
jgi:phage FluMu gp28-like protein